MVDAAHAFTHRTDSGLDIVADRWTNDAAPSVVLLHGGGQTRHAWAETARQLVAEGYGPITVDLRGHGDSDWSPAGDYDLSAIAGDIASLCAALPDQPVLVGASLGGISGIMLEGLIAPGSLRSLVLVDIVPRMNSGGADRIVEFMSERAAEGFETLDEVADAIGAFNPNRARPTDVDGLRKNLRERDGRWFWHWDPEFITFARNNADSEMRNPDLMASTLAGIDIPVLLIRGRQSDLVTDDEVADFRAEFPSADYVDVAGAGHMVAGDRNDAFANCVLEHLRTLDQPPATQEND